MKTRVIFILVYSLIILCGGIVGFIKAQSFPSLVMGVSFAIALAICGYVMMKGSSIAYYAASVLTLVLSLFFTYRLIISHRFMPAGLMCILSLVMLAILLFSRESE
jgi:uncharacterized membrane protein (UPF0136 family)